MRIALFTKNKVGFIDGTYEKNKFKKELHDQWDRCNNFFLLWIMNVVTKELYSSVVYASSAYNVWSDLQERFDNRNISRIYNLHQEIIALKQGLAPISTYFSKLKDLRDEYDAMTPIPSCGAIPYNTCHKVNRMNYNSIQGAPPMYRQKTQLYCDYCKLKGHTKDNCYKLVGYPEDYKPKRESFARNTDAAHNVQLDVTQGSKE
ncbi:uncharacterized protein LOC142178281 [Nicotiana tabacum]|uniref:Uncharacterized protein LOC142178281 n=1 Tax=Nicotiana tabacum TaxID=4097 RepID=A0AC58U2K9_TOBAC